MSNNNEKKDNDSLESAIRRQFECYYIGKDGNTVRHRQQWLYRFSYVFPKIELPNNPPTPLWLEPMNSKMQNGITHKYWLLHAQLNSNIATYCDTYFADEAIIDNDIVTLYTDYTALLLDKNYTGISLCDIVSHQDAKSQKLEELLQKYTFQRMSSLQL